MPLDVTFDDTERMDGITLNPTKKNGQPAAVEAGKTRATVQAGDCTAEVDADGKINIISGTPGSGQVLIEADADLGDGEVLISDVINVTIAGSLAQNLGLQPGTVRPK